MTGLFGTWFAYGVGRAFGQTVFGDRDGGRDPKGPIRQQSEAEILADEKRYDAQAKALEADAKAAKKAKR